MSTEMPNKDGYRKLRYPNGTFIYFSEDLAKVFHSKFNHKKRTKQFPYFRNLIDFIQVNPSICIHFTIEQSHAPFVIEGNDYFVNIDSYVDFCKKIESSTQGRAQAFFGQHINHSKFLTSDEKHDIVSSASLEEIIDVANNMGESDRQALLNGISESNNINLTLPEFTEEIAHSTASIEKRKVIIASYPHVQLETLKEHRAFLANNLDKNETFIQNWIDAKIDNMGQALDCDDEYRDKLKRSRCLIFGLEYLNHKREGPISQKRFDLLTKISDGRSEYVLIELKSPSGRVFDIAVKKNTNEGESTTYSLSDDIARAIPQIFSYKGLLSNASNTDWQRYGLSRGEVVKSIILVGTRLDDNPVWNDHYMDLKRGLSSSIEIMTYTDLLDKLDSTIKNLEVNL